MMKEGHLFTECPLGKQKRTVVNNVVAKTMVYWAAIIFYLYNIVLVMLNI